VDLKTLAGGLLLSAVILVGTISAAAAHHYDAPQYPMPTPGPGPTYNFYGPTTNYFGPAGEAETTPADYYGPPAYYGEAPPPYGYGQPDLPPQQYYDGARLDPWNGYNGAWGSNGY
jgi:hypothetical protein